MKKTAYIWTVILAGLICVNFVCGKVERIEQGNVVTEGIPPVPAQIAERMRQYQNIRGASAYGWHPSGDGIIISTRFGQTSQVHHVERPGGARRQITFFDEPASGGVICPDPSEAILLFYKDIGGSETYQIFQLDLNDGSYTMITDGQSRYGAVRWSNKADKFIFHSTKRNGRDWDLYLSDASNPKESRMILQCEGMWRPVDFSPDDKRLLVSKYVSVNESYYYVLEIASGKLEQVNPTTEKIAYGAAVWAKDGRGLFIVSDQGDEFRRLKYYDLGKNTFTVLTPGINWDIREVKTSSNRDNLVFSANVDGVYRAYIMDTTTMAYKQIPGTEFGMVYGFRFHNDGNRLAMGIASPQTPGDVYSYNIKQEHLERWTDSEVGGLNTDSFVVPKLIYYDTFDNDNSGQKRKISAFYYEPEKSKAPYPVLIDIHGGPEAQYRLYFSAGTQYYVNELGIAVLAPNVRGSLGYGKSYLKLDNGYLRENSVKDIGSLLDWIEKQPELDASRVAVIGGSYGGYMVLSSMTHFNDRLKCGIDIVGISNFVTFLKNTKEYRRDRRRAEYGDERDRRMRKFLLKISPTTNVHKITKPMFIAQGLNDPRVPVTESEQMVATIRKSGGTVWYLLFKDEGHGFNKKRNRDYFNNIAVMFLEKYLLK